MVKLYKNIEKKADFQQKRIVLSAFNSMDMNDSTIYTTVNSLRNHLANFTGQTVGFVPTMGALHHGHLSLVKQAMEECDHVVVSIFVNPTQFNNQEDLKKYPRTLEKDVELLNTVGEVSVFAPEVDQVYPSDFKKIDLDLGSLGEVMEGKFRPGHFEGVMNVVKRLFDIVQPQRAYFGIKDFQQVAVIRFMVRELNLPIEIVPCAIIRELSGLASSSRNVRLSPREKEEALVLYHSLQRASKLMLKLNPDEVTDLVKKVVDSSPLELEYFEIVHPDTLQPINRWVPGANACIAAYCGAVRLIDNMQLIPLPEISVNLH